MSYIDKFLNDIHLEFRDRFKNELENSKWFSNFEFQSNYEHVLAMAEQWARTQAKIPKQMRTFDESQKSKKTVASMIERKDDKENKKQGMYLQLHCICFTNIHIYIYILNLINIIIYSN